MFFDFFLYNLYIYIFYYLNLKNSKWLVVVFRENIVLYNEIILNNVRLKGGKKGIEIAKVNQANE